MKNLQKTSIAVLALILSTFAGQAEPLTREIAAKIIAEAEQVRNNEINIGPLQEVHRKVDAQTTAINGICVTFIAPVISEDTGIRRRQVQYRTFFHDEEWGWYLFGIISERGGPGIDVITQKKGRIKMR